MLLLAASPAGAQTNVDYDTNDNRLIEIDSLAKLNAIRYDLNGDGTVDSAGDQTSYDAGFANALSAQCPSGCLGYELTANLNFDSDGDGDVDINDHSGAYWDSGAGWTPIGTFSAPYAATFHGNGHTISNLFISRSTGYTGLFGNMDNVRLSNLGLVNANVTGGNFTGGIAGRIAHSSSRAVNLYATGQVSGGTQVGLLVGFLGGTLAASYTSGSVNASAQHSGGLAGRLNGNGSVIASYSTASSTANQYGGGLVGIFWDGSTAVTASYATGAASHGGLAGVNGNNAPITNSYYDSRTSGRTDTGNGEPKTTAELQSPTRYEGIYAQWNVNVDGVEGADDPWDFGSPRHYPALQVDFNGDGVATCREFGPQRCYTEPGPPPYNWRADHPESYANARHGITAACEVQTTGEGDDAVTTSTLTFDLAEYTRPITLALSLWDRTHFRSLQSLGIAMPSLQRDGQTATVEVATDPARTRFRLDGPYGLNLVLGYADCHTDDS